MEGKNTDRIYRGEIIFSVCILTAGTVLTILAIATGSRGSRMVMALVFWLLTVLTPLYIIFRSKIWRRSAEELKGLNNRLAEEEVRAMQAELDQKRQELHALQNQINPHFLYNTLDTFRGVALEHNDRMMADLLASLSSMFKYSVNYETSMVTLNRELSYLNQYMKIQQLRFPGRFDFEEKILCRESRLALQECPRLVLQPLVENAIRHGFRQKRQDCRIVVIAETAGEDFLITVQDNGCGMDVEQENRLNSMFRKGEAPHGGDEGGIGLLNVHRRIAMCCGEGYGLGVFSSPGGGTRFVIRLPLTGGRELVDES